MFNLDTSKPETKLSRQELVIIKAVSVAKTLALSLCLAQTSASQAALDTWTIIEAFSNADGDIQFVELLSPTDIKLDLPGTALDSINYEGEVVASAQLTGSTLLSAINTSVLFATPAFVEATGIEADVELPENFLPIDGGQLNFGMGTSVLNLERGKLPLNGEQSFSFIGGVLPATPRNFSGDSGRLSVPINAAFNADTATLVLPVLDVQGFGLVNVNFAVDPITTQLELKEDFYVFEERVHSTSTTPTLFSDNTLLIPRLPIEGIIYELEATLILDNPIVFGNLNILSITTE